MKKIFILIIFVIPLLSFGEIKYGIEVVDAYNVTPYRVCNSAESIDSIYYVDYFGMAGTLYGEQLEDVSEADEKMGYFMLNYFKKMHANEEVENVEKPTVVALLGYALARRGRLDFKVKEGDILHSSQPIGTRANSYVLIQMPGHRFVVIPPDSKFIYKSKAE